MSSAESFAELVRESRQKAYNFAYRLCGNDSDASDLMQEAYVQAYASHDSFDPSRPFGPWVLRIIHNLFVNRVKSAHARRTVSLDENLENDGEPRSRPLSAGDPEPADVLMRQEQGDQVQKALASLEPHYRSAVILCDVEGWSYEEIARVLSCPVGTVKSRIFQARKKMRKYCDDLDTAGSRS